MFGEWNVKVSKNYPQKLASEFEGVMSTLIGAKYEPFLYLGSQEVNGTNHAVLCEQTLLNGTQTKNIVVVILNEREGDFYVVEIKPLLRQGGPLGGFAPAVNTTIPEEAAKLFNDVIGAKIGCESTAWAYLGEKVEKGTNRYYLVESKPVYRGEPKSVVEVYCVNDLTHAVKFIDALEPEEATSFSLGCPLGEWP